MKKTVFYFVTVALTVSMYSCKKEDKEPSIVAKWEFSQSGYIDKSVSQTDENLVDWPHGCSTNKDYAEYKSDGQCVSKVFFDCSDNDAPETGTYTYSNNKITTISSGITEVVDVKSLTSETLKVELIQTADYSDIYVFNRAN